MASARTPRNNGFECQAEARTSCTTWRLTTVAADKRFFRCGFAAMVVVCLEVT
jgi:hypothetical protein